MSYKSEAYAKKITQPNLKTQPTKEVQKKPNKPWIAKVITLFPDMFPGTLSYSVLGRALKESIWSLEVINLRDFGIGKHKDVDGTPSGGGPGMILRPDVVDRAIIKATNNINLTEANWLILNLTPRGQPLTQAVSRELANMDGIIILCGRFEGIDQRVIDKWKMQEISLGDFIITGGEIAAQAIIDSAVRNIPNVLGNSISVQSESFNYNLLEHPQYTKPSNWKGQTVPEVLLSGNHQKIKDWKDQQSFEITKNRRPDLLTNAKK